MIQNKVALSWRHEACISDVAPEIANLQGAASVGGVVRGDRIAAFKRMLVEHNEPALVDRVFASSIPYRHRPD